MEQTGIPLKTGEMINFTIHGNPTTGYQWSADQDAANGAFSIQRHYETNPAGSGMVGVGGLYTFEVTAGDSEGEGIFSISYARPWEPANMSFSSHQIPIHVSP